VGRKRENRGETVSDGPAKPGKKTAKPGNEERGQERKRNQRVILADGEAATAVEL
jgi:hypothetical protein